MSVMTKRVRWFGLVAGLAILMVSFQNCGNNLPSIDEPPLENASTAPASPTNKTPNTVLPTIPNVTVTHPSQVARVGNMNLVPNGDFAQGAANFQNPWADGGPANIWTVGNVNPANKTLAGPYNFPGNPAFIVTCQTPPCSSAHHYLLMDIPRPQVPAGTVIRYGFNARGVSKTAKAIFGVQQIDATRGVSIDWSPVNVIVYHAAFDMISLQNTIKDDRVSFLRILVFPIEAEPIIVDDFWIEY